MRLPIEQWPNRWLRAKGRVTGNRSFSTTPLSRSYNVEVEGGKVVDGAQA